MERLHDAPFAFSSTASTSLLGVEESPLLSSDIAAATAAAMLVSPVDDDAILKATLMQQREEQQKQQLDRPTTTVQQNSFANPSFRFFPNSLHNAVGEHHRSHHLHPHQHRGGVKEYPPLLTPDESSSWADFRFLGLDPNENNDDDDGSAQLLVAPPSPTSPSSSSAAKPSPSLPAKPTTTTTTTPLPSATTTSTQSRFKKMPSPGSNGGCGGGGSSSSSSSSSAASKKRRTYNKVDISSTMGVPLLAEQMEDEEDGEEEEEDEEFGVDESEDTESVGMVTKENSLADLNNVAAVTTTTTTTTTTSPPAQQQQQQQQRVVRNTASSPTSRLIDNHKTTTTDSTDETTMTATSTKSSTTTTTTTTSSFLNFYANLESKTSNAVNNGANGGGADIIDSKSVNDDNDDDENDNDDDDDGETKKKHFSSLNNLLDENGMGQEEVEGMVVEDEDLDDAEEEDEEDEEDKPEGERGQGVVYAQVLPAGWERHESDDGPYYWHIKSGTIQLEPPEGTVRRPKPPPPPPHPASLTPGKVAEKNLKNKEKEEKAGSFSSFSYQPVEDEDAATAGQQHLRDFEDHALKFASESLKHLELLEHRKAALAGGNGVTATAGVGGVGDDVIGVEEDDDKIMMSGPGMTPSTPPRRFAVKSLGWLQVEESDLTPERSSKAVNRCIVELSNPGSARHSVGGVGGRGGGVSGVGHHRSSMDSIGGWGAEGKALTMEISDDHLILTDAANDNLCDATTTTVTTGGVALTKLSIQSIRVWGVGRDNEHDFAYVAREKSAARQYLCHVFRCETPARAIANALRDACRRLMAERQKVASLRQRQLVQKAESVAAAAAAAAAGSTTTTTTAATSEKNNPGKRTLAARPGSLPMSYRNGPSSSSSSSSATADMDAASSSDVVHNGGGASTNPLSLTSFPTPMEEPRKAIKAEYLGSVQVPKPMGMEMLTPAIEKLSTRVPRERWQKVDVVVAPSTVQVVVTESKFGTDAGETVADCRVRYLSFMGIGKDVKFYAFINHTPEDTFVCHVFYVEPTAAALCKTIEAACKLRFQKCLDGEMRRGSKESPSSSTSSYSLLSPIGGGGSGGSGRSGLGSSLKEGVRTVFNNLSQKLKTPQ